MDLSPQTIHLPSAEGAALRSHFADDEEPVTACRCQFCGANLEPVQELRFLVETETLDNPTHLNRIRRLPYGADGRPLRVCQSCHHQIETNPTRFRAVVERARHRRQLRTGMLAAVGILSAGWVLGLLLHGPRT